MSAPRMRRAPTCLWSAQRRQRVETLFLVMRSPQTFLVVMTHYHKSLHSLHEMHVSYVHVHTGQCVIVMSHTLFITQERHYAVIW